jgi:hypothetical protein
MSTGLHPLFEFLTTPMFSRQRPATAVAYLCAWLSIQAILITAILDTFIRGVSINSGSQGCGSVIANFVLLVPLQL